MNERSSPSIWTILILIFTTTLVRVFLEFFSNPDMGMVIGPWYGFLQYFLFFTTMALGIGVILGFIIQEPIKKWVFVVSKSLPIIFLAPIIDLIISRGSGLCMAYLGSSGLYLVRDFFMFGGPLGTCGISIGMRIEVLIILMAIGLIIWNKTKKLFLVLVGIFFTYLFIFLNAAIPGIFGIQVISSLPLREFIFFISGIHFLTAVILLLAIWFREKKALFTIWMKGSQPERIIYYILLAILGMCSAYKLYTISLAPIDSIKFILCILSILTSGWAAIVLNNFHDQDIDSISNSDRPLLSGEISHETYRNLGVTFFIVSILSALLVNYGFLFFILGTQALYATYAFRATGWKKHFIGSSLTIGLAGVFMALAGYFAFSPDQSFSQIPILSLLFLFITLAILSNAKDFKDIAGDRAGAIKTLPVLLGARKAGLILSFSLSVWFIILGLILKNPIIALFAAPWIVLDLIIRKRVPGYVRFLIVFLEIIIGIIMLLN